MQANEVTITIAYAGVNRADLVQRAGHYPPPPGASDVLGLEVSGVIDEVGKDVRDFKSGDEVCALLTGGGYAKSVSVPAGQVLPIPTGLDLKLAATLPEAFATAWYNLMMLAKLQPHERVLLHAGASGVGTAAIQLCKEFAADCYATAGSNEKLQHCRTLGASGGWNRHDGDFVGAVNEWGGADVILDPVGGDYFASNQQVMHDDGRLIVIGLLGGRHAQIDMGRVLMKRQRIIGSTLRNQSVTVKTEIMQQLHKQVWPKLAQGSIKPQLDKVFELHEVDAAHDYVSADKNIGKVLLKVPAAD
ncbi:MAG: NAD(P)H-quinone oxidoreductase [Idiomarina sp.]